MMKIALILVFIVFTISGFSQDFEDYPWKNRLIIIKTTSFDNPIVQKQLEYLKTEQEGLKERKLVIFTLTPMYYRMNFSKETME